MLLMLAVVACYTICSLSDKYAVSKLKMNGSTLTFIMAAATAFFMLACRSTAGISTGASRRTSRYF